MAEEDMMDARPPMDAAMDMPTETRMPAEAVKRLMQPSEEIQAVLIARISNMAPEELRMLDSAIPPDVARVLMKLLPELREIIAQIGQAPQRPPMGALGGM